MTEKKVSDQHHTTFDGIRHLDEAGNEFWQARQLAKVLEYSEYRHFVPVIDRAKVACQTSGQHRLRRTAFSKEKRIEEAKRMIVSCFPMVSAALRQIKVTPPVSLIYAEG